MYVEAILLFAALAAADVAKDDSAKGTEATVDIGKLEEKSRGGDLGATFQLAHEYQLKAIRERKDQTNPNARDEADKLEKKAMELLEENAKQNHVKSMNNLAVMHKEGTYGAVKNDELAVKWFAEAAEKGYVTAKLNLAVMLLAGRGAPKDEKLAAAMLKHASTDEMAPDLDAMVQLAKLYVNGTGVQKSEALAMSWLKKAADGGHQRAKKMLHEEL